MAEVQDQTSLWMLVPLISTMGFAAVGWFNSWRTAIVSEEARKQATAAAAQAATAAQIAEENKRKLAEVGKQFDGRLSQLLMETEKAQRALGIIEGGDKERAIAGEASQQAKEIVEVAAIRATEVLNRAAALAESGGDKERAVVGDASRQAREIVELAATHATEVLDKAAVLAGCDADKERAVISEASRRAREIVELAAIRATEVLNRAAVLAESGGDRAIVSDAGNTTNASYTQAKDA